jgi:hypothetical protein
MTGPVVRSAGFKKTQELILQVACRLGQISAFLAQQLRS